MENSLEIIKKTCIREGASDVGFSIYKGAQTAVLFYPYAVFSPVKGDKAALSGYYPVSNSAYHSVKRICESLNEKGICAVHDTELPARYCAALTGGSILKNGMYCHPSYGCNVHIQTILLGPVSEAYEEHTDFEVCRDCEGCGRCIKACPFGAITEDGIDTEKCMRRHIMDSEIPERLYPYIYQLFGCERCQLCCPKTSKTDSEPYLYSIEDLIRGKCNSELKSICGPNMARPMRIRKQALIMAANKGLKELIPLISSLDDSGIINEKRYALQRLTEYI